MGDFRSVYRSYGGDRKLEIVNGKAFSANQIYTSRARSPDPPRMSKPSRSSSSKSKSWSFNDPEMKRRKRVAQYKVYAVEGKYKASFRKGFRWIKSKCSEIVHGF
ncbi:hypothetical protein HHK36_026441 [Tetracentron sinense]|uniref:DUF3511 domain-containing protein n=1 Tax=Tetracentron sinense TaxID=13715 RepID=A0A834YLF3_TETSI|nr:hypothetical protein HHK36_026441 [Tetracentron sinense]